MSTTKAEDAEMANVEDEELATAANSKDKSKKASVEKDD